MDINILVLGLMALLLGSYAWKAWTTPKDAPPPNFLPFVPIDLRTTKVYVSPTKDASMYTERSRRAAIISNIGGGYSYKGSTNGSLERNFLSSILIGLPPKVCPAPEFVADGGNATSDVCDVIDGSGEDVLDFGDSAANVCD